MTTKSESSAYKLILLVLLVPSMIYSGWALTVLWGWFIVTTFGLPAITIPQAIGMSVVIGYLTHQTKPDNKEMTTEKFVSSLILVLLRPAFALLVGAIVKNFI